MIKKITCGFTTYCPCVALCKSSEYSSSLVILSTGSGVGNWLFEDLGPYIINIFIKVWYQKIGIL